MRDDADTNRLQDDADADDDYQPLRLQRPCRVIRVKRIPVGYALVGETWIGDGASVRWRVRTFSHAVHGGRAEVEANLAGAAFARRLPPWFNGCSYFVDSTGRAEQVRAAESADHLSADPR